MPLPVVPLLVVGGGLALGALLARRPRGAVGTSPPTAPPSSSTPGGTRPGDTSSGSSAGSALAGGAALAGAAGGFAATEIAKVFGTTEAAKQTQAAAPYVGAGIGVGTFAVAGGTSGIVALVGTAGLIPGAIIIVTPALALITMVLQLIYVIADAVRRAEYARRRAIMDGKLRTAIIAGGGTAFGPEGDRDAVWSAWDYAVQSAQDTYPGLGFKFVGRPTWKTWALARTVPVDTDGDGLPDARRDARELLVAAYGQSLEAGDAMTRALDAAMPWLVPGCWAYAASTHLVSDGEGGWMKLRRTPQGLVAVDPADVFETAQLVNRSRLDEIKARLEAEGRTGSDATEGRTGPSSLTRTGGDL